MYLFFTELLAILPRNLDTSLMPERQKGRALIKGIKRLGVGLGDPSHG